MDHTLNSFKQNFILFQTLSKKRSIHLRNINNSKNNLLTNLKGKLQTYSSSIIKVNEFANNKNSFNYILNDNSNKFSKLNYNFDTYLLIIFTFLKNNPYYMYHTIKNIKNEDKRIKLAEFIINNLFLNALTLKSAEDEFLMLVTKIIYEDLDIKQINNKGLFVNDSIMNDLTSLMRNTWEISQFLFELLLLPMKILEQQKDSTVLDIQGMKMILKSKSEENKNVEQLHENAIEYLFNQKHPMKFKDINNFYLNTISDRAYLYKQISISAIGDKYPYLSHRQCSLTLNTFNELLQKESNPAIKEYLSSQMKMVQSNNTLYTNLRFINQVNNMKESTEIYSLHLKHCYIIIAVIDNIIDTLLSNINQIPLCIKYICKIIEIVYKKKHEKASEYDVIKVMAKFLFEMLINPVLVNPTLVSLFNMGFLPSNKQTTLGIVEHILKNILNGELFQDSTESHYSKLNNYCIQATIKVIKLFTKIQSQVKLPEYITEYLNENTNHLTEYEYIKWNANQSIQNNFFLYSIEDILIIIEGNESLFNNNNNNEQNNKIEVFISSLSNLKNLISSLTKLFEEDCKNNSKNYYLANEIITLNNDLSNEKTKQSLLNDNIISLIENMRIVDDLFFEMFNVTSMESFITNLPFIVNNYSYILNHNNQKIIILDEIMETYDSFTNEEKQKFNSSFLTEIISTFQNELNNLYLSDLHSLEEYVSIIDKKNSEYCYLLNLLEDRIISKICKIIIEQHQIPIETIINKPFFNRGYNELIINEVIKKKYKKNNDITETIKEFCDRFSLFTLNDFFSINPNIIIEQYNKSFIPREINKLFTIVSNSLSNKETIQTFIKNEPHVSSLYTTSSCFIEKITCYIHCRLETILHKNQPSNTDCQLISQYVFLNKLEITSHCNAIKRAKLSKMEHYLCSLGQLSSPKDLIYFFTNLINNILDYKALDKSGTFLIVFYYVIKLSPFNLNGMLDYISCFYNITDAKMKNVFSLLKKTVSILLQLKNENFEKIEPQTEFNQAVLNEILTMLSE